MAGSPTRRGFLGSAATAAAVGLAGCTGGGGGNGDSDDEAGVALADHPLGEDLDRWPHLGPDPFEAPATLVVLDDPSCPTCARFHRNTITELESSYVADGDLALAIRPYPVVYPWGEPAAHILEATVPRDEGVFWDLLEQYFADQDAFNTDNVRSRSETWLEENTDLDAAAVIDDADSEPATSRIEATLSAGEEAGAGSVTPATFAFVDGTLRTSLNGSVSTNTVETALELG